MKHYSVIGEPMHNEHQSESNQISANKLMSVSRQSLLYLCDWVQRCAIGSALQIVRNRSAVHCCNAGGRIFL
jgi:hypothetical protein